MADKLRIAINPSSQDWADNGVHEGRVQHVIGYALAAEIQRRGHATMVTQSPHDLVAEMDAVDRFAPDKMICLHNEGSGNVATGIDVIWNDADDKALRDALVRELTRAFPGKSVEIKTDVAAAGHTLYVLRRDHWPSSLVEWFNAECDAEAKLILDPKMQARYVNALANALVGPGLYDVKVGRYGHATLVDERDVIEIRLNKKLAPGKVRFVKARPWGGAPTEFMLVGPFGLSWARKILAICEDSGRKAVIVPHT